MTSEYKLEVFKREELGKQDVRKLRQKDMVPGIYYSHGSRKSIPFMIDRKELSRAVKSGAHLYKVSVGGKLRNVIFKEIQYHPVTDEVIHLDLYGVRMDETVDIKVPLHLVGTPEGVSIDGGHLTQQLVELDVRCLPDAIPDFIEVDVTKLRKGESLHVESIEFPENVECLTPGEVVFVSIVHGVRAEDIVLQAEEAEDITFEEETEEGAAETE